MYIYISISIYKCCGWKKSCTQLIGGLSHYIYGLQPSKVMQDLFPSTVYIYIYTFIYMYNIRKWGYNWDIMGYHRHIMGCSGI